MSKSLCCIVFALILSGACFAQAAPAAKPRNRAMATHHTIKAAARPFKSLAHATKTLAVGTATFSFSAFDTTVIDPFGVALQALADGLDMFVAGPLESMPEPLEAVGDGVHFVYLGIDKAGQQLAK